MKKSNKNQMHKGPCPVKRRSGKIFWHQKDRAAETEQTLNYTIHELREIVNDALKLPCPYCADEVTSENFSLDHVTPISRGGTYDKDNLVCCCERCNKIKGVMDGDEFGQLIGTIAHFQKDAQKSVMTRLYAGARFIYPKRK